MKKSYRIMKQRKTDRKTIGFLSPRKARWLPSMQRSKHGLFTEHEANTFIQAHNSDKEYYYFKTITL